MVDLGDFLDSDTNSEAFGVSADGSVIVGTINAPLNPSSLNEAFRWTAETGIVGLGDLPSGEFRSSALGVSADGSVILGYGSSANGREAYR